MPGALQSTADKAYEIYYTDLPKEVKTWIIEHPYQTTFHIANGIVFFYPSLVTGPVFWSLGWTSAGPRAGKQTSTLPYLVSKYKSPLTISTGSAAAALMAKFGLVPSHGAYAYLQSSAMGGYGSALVQGLTRAGSGVVGGSQWLNSYLHGRKTSKADDTAGVERSQEGGVEVDEPAELKAKL